MTDEDRDTLGHVLYAAARIATYCAGMTLEEFTRDERTQDAVIRNIEVIGEAVSRVSEEIRSEHQEIAWGQAIATRNRLIHGYFSVSVPIVWETATRDIPRLSEQIQKIIPETSL